ncbi:MAG: hypothetical protein JWN40_22 [Phycisphaerales bacterium]|nr:hypothetical protein [Phycisphaerales bacterium]
MSDSFSTRDYKHLRCGELTTIGGIDYRMLRHPMEAVSTTFCATCGKQFPLIEFEWADNGENLQEYRSNMATSSSIIGRLLVGVIPVVVLAGFVYVAVTRYSTPNLKLIGFGILAMFGALIVTAIAVNAIFRVKAAER